MARAASDTNRQGSRLIAAATALAALYLILWRSTESASFLAGTGPEAFLFLAAGLSLVLTVYVSTPHFAKPADVLTSSVLLVLALLLYDTGLPRAVLWALSIYASAIAVGAVLVSSRRRRTRSSGPDPGYQALLALGRPASLYAMAIGAVAVANLPPANNTLWLVLVWDVIVFGHKSVAKIASSLHSRINLPSSTPTVIGIVQYQVGESLFAVGALAGRHLPPAGSLVGLPVISGATAIAQVTRTYVGPDGPVAWAVPQRTLDGYVLLTPGSDSPRYSPSQLDVIGSCVEIPTDWLPATSSAAVLGANFVEEIVGQVARGTDSTSVRVDLVARLWDWSEGDVLVCNVQGVSCYLQIVSVELAISPDEDGYRDAITRATCVALGSYSREDSAFETVPWVPEIGAPVARTSSIDAAEVPEGLTIGTLQGLELGVLVRNPDALVTKNTMVLGALGSGKSTVARRIVTHLANVDIRTIMIDVTREHFAPLHATLGQDQVVEGTSGLETGLAAKVDYVRTEGSGNNMKEFIEGSGNVDLFRKNARRVLCDFLFEGGGPKNPAAPEIDGAGRVLVLNPDLVEVTEGAKMGFKVVPRHLSAAEKTRVIAAEILDIFMKLGPTATEVARLAVVFEEAHLLVPEFSFAADEGDREASNGIARVVLQGRKYGLGAIVVAQRTANVSKSVLTQCMTTVALRTMDETGQSFLANQLGEHAASALNKLPDYSAYVAGAGFNLRSAVRVSLPPPGAP